MSGGKSRPEKLDLEEIERFAAKLAAERDSYCIAAASFLRDLSAEVAALRAEVAQARKITAVSP